jgi:hypothetical protein
MLSRSIIKLEANPAPILIYRNTCKEEIKTKITISFIHVSGKNGKDYKIYSSSLKNQ